MSSLSQVTSGDPDKPPPGQDKPPPGHKPENELPVVEVQNPAKPGDSNQVHGNPQIVLAVGTMLKSTPGFVGTA